jgi:ATP-dependent Lhr-like helicase
MNGETCSDPFSGFHPLVQSWFLEKYGRPTQVQALAWPIIAAGGHLLAAAPTGSGKTLAAFLVAISRFTIGADNGGLDPSCLSVLYVSPLKALNEDIRLNLLGPLRELDAYFAARGAVFPRVRVATRSGDTPPAERRRTLSDPPSVLCTTPESLAILLASKRGLELLSDLKLVILDEVHAVLGNKRGTLLACSVGRLVTLAGEFQRVALSATVKPFEVAADFVGGQRLLRSSNGSLPAGQAVEGQAVHEPRKVAIVAARTDKRYELSVEWPPEIVVSGATGQDGPEGIPAGRYTAMAAALVEDLKKTRGSEGREGGQEGGRPTIVFTDSRRRAERLASVLNELGGDGTAWAHHGSLSREVRHAVEERLRRGELPCVVATGTLELGLDIGSVEKVALAGTPSRADQVLQRIGRAGHSVGQASTGVFYPFHGMDLLQAASAVGAALDGDVDPARIPEAPLDVLAQTLLSMVLFSERSLDGLFDEVRCFPPYVSLSRKDFDLVVGMLSGRYHGTRLKELAPRVYLDQEKQTIRAREGAAMLLYSSGGSIPDRGYYALRLAGVAGGLDGVAGPGERAGAEAGGSVGAKIGELDEEFVFERRVGNSFAFGSQAWKIVSIGDEAVTVVPLDRDADFMPFWKADKAPRGKTLSLRMQKLCAAREADPGGFRDLLTGTCGFGSTAADTLVSWLDRQQRAQGGGRLPSPESIAMETYRDPLAETKGLSTAVILHTLRGSPINEPLGLALAAALEERTGLPVERLGDDDSILLILPLESASEAEALVCEALASLGNPAVLARLVRSGLEATGAFGAAFRENAGRALLLPRSGFGKRTPLWVTRLKAKRLFAKIKEVEEFPIVMESWRSVLEGRFDLPGLNELCEQLGSGDTELVRYRTTAPSPFAARLGWNQTNRFLYEGDELGASGSRKAFRVSKQAGGPAGNSRGPGAREGRSALDDAVERAIGSASLRPSIPFAVARDVGAKIRRELAGWAPETPDALADWVDERVFIPMDEWQALLAACSSELADAAGAALAALTDPSAAKCVPGLLSRLVLLKLPGSTLSLVLRRERKKELLADPAAFIGEWLRSSGPVPVRRLEALFGLDSKAVQETLADLEDAGLVLCDQASFGIASMPAEAWVCDRDVLDGLLRATRRSARVVVKPRPASFFPAFVAFIHGLDSAQSPVIGSAGQGAGVTRMNRSLEVLSGYPARAGLWETELLPARIHGYRAEQLDGAIGSGDWLWFGSGRGSLALARAEDISLFISPPSSALCPPGSSPRDVWGLKDASRLQLDDLQASVWKEVWRGALSSDSFEAVRKGLLSDFKADNPSSETGKDGQGLSVAGNPNGRRKLHARVPLAIRDRWKRGAPLPGRWFGLAMEPVELDEADVLDLAADRVRVIARRYGLVARFLLERELPLLGWSSLFSAIRRLELSGELVSGHFFSSVDGPQFMAREQLAAFRDGAGAQGIWVVNACDPAAPSAPVIPAGSWPGAVPTRVASTRIVCLGPDVACVSRRSYRDLDIAVDPDDERLPAILAFLGEARNRDIDPVRRIILETINGRAASNSAYAPVLKTLGFESDRRRLVLW